MNTEENQNVDLSHPLFSFQDDPYLSLILRRLNFLINPENPDALSEDISFKEIMKNIVFHDQDLNKLQQASFFSTTLCSKSISKGDICFVCLECNTFSHPNIYAVVCVDCFDKSNHKGHRLLRILQEEDDRAANCDCGDNQFLKSEGFCSDHQSKPVNMQELYQNFPQDLRVDFQMIIKKSIYAVVSLFEIKQQYVGSIENYDSILILAETLLRDLLHFAIECYSEVNRAFLPILWNALRDQFDSPWELVFHDCQDLHAAQNNTNRESHKCTCSLAGSLFRISNLITRENQEELMNILVECVKDQDFLGYLSVEFVKHIKFFFIENNVPDQTSLLVDLFSQLFLYDAVLIKILDSGYFSNLLEMMKKIVESSMVVNLRVFKIIDQIVSILDYFLIPKRNSAQRVVKDTNFMLQYLDIIMTYQMKFFYAERLTTSKFDHEINYDGINTALRGERRLCKAFENYIKLIYDLPEDEKKQALDLVLQNWNICLQNAKAVLKDDDGQPFQSFNPCLERVFCCINLGSLKDAEGGSLVSEETALRTLEGPLRALGMVRYLHLTYNYKYGKIFTVYYYVWNSFFETDVVTTQMMLALLKPEEGLFELLVQNFFSYSPEIQEFFKNPNEENYQKKLLTAIEDFLYFLVFLMTDEICMIGVETKYKKDQCSDMKYNTRQRSVLKNLLVNILRGFYWTTSKQIKEVFERFLIAEPEVDEIISQITIKDEKQHKIRIKDEYESNVDPYILYRHPSYRQDIVQNFAMKNSQKNHSVDLIPGGIFDKDCPQYLKDIQAKLYQSNLPKFLSKYLKMANLKTGSALIRLVLKLILLNLQVADDSPLLGQKIEETYINDDFLNILSNISTEGGLKDCKSCIENIKKLLHKFRKTDNMQVEESPRTQKDEDINAKKRLTAQERMAQLIQNFAQKQAAFAQSDQYLLQKSMNFEDTEESKKDENLICQHCMEKLHVSGEEYGLPIYVTFTNNFYDVTTTQEKAFVEQDYTNFLKADWWPVISSCHHYYHKKCFEILYQAPKGQERNFLSSRYDTFCPLCKGLCNNFLSINGEEAVQKDDMNQEVPQDQLEQYPQIYQTFTKKIQKILLNLKANISPAGHATALEEAAFVPIETIFERAYQYFVESFYLLESSQNLEKSFELYRAFFKGFKTYFKDPDLKIPEDNLQLSAFFNVNNLFLSTQAASPSKELNYKTESYLVELLAKNLQRILASSSDDTSGKSELLALKNFILFKVVQTIAFNSSDDANFKLEDCFQLYQSNQALRSLILEQLTFPIQKIILSYALNISTASSPSPHCTLTELFNLLLNMSSHQEEYLTDLFHSVNLPCSFPELILEIFQELPSRPQSEINFLNSLFDANLFNKETLKPQLVKFAPRMIQLPDTCLEFNTHYFSQKCNLCQKFSSHLYTSICLICGEVLCTAYCNKNPNQAGNLNRHAKKYHMGMGLFLDVQRFKENLVNSPVNTAYTKTGLYLDNLGQDIIPLLENPFPSKIAKFDFTHYKLNQEYMKELHDIVYQQTLRKEIFSVGIRINRKVTDHFL